MTWPRAFFPAHLVERDDAQARGVILGRSKHAAQVDAGGRRLGGQQLVAGGKVLQASAGKAVQVRLLPADGGEDKLVFEPLLA